MRDGYCEEDLGHVDIRYASLARRLYSRGSFSLHSRRCWETLGGRFVEIEM